VKKRYFQRPAHKRSEAYATYSYNFVAIKDKRWRLDVKVSEESTVLRVPLTYFDNYDSVLCFVFVYIYICNLVFQLSFISR